MKTKKELGTVTPVALDFRKKNHFKILHSKLSLPLNPLRPLGSITVAEDSINSFQVSISLYFIQMFFISAAVLIPLYWCSCCINHYSNPYIEGSFM